MQTVKLENGEIHEFPDEATHEQIMSALYGMPKNNSNNAVDNNSTDPMDSRRKQLEYALGSNRSPVDTIRDVGQGVLTGLGKGGQYIARKVTGGRAPEVDFDQMFSSVGSPNKSIGGEIAKGVGSYLPYAAVGGAGLGGQMLAGAAHGAATTGEDESNLMGFLPQGSTGGAIEGALVNALTHGAFKGLEKLRPSKIFKSNLSKKELQGNLEAARGTEEQVAQKYNELESEMKQNNLSYTPEELLEEARKQAGTATGIGDVIGSPFLKKRYENEMAAIPFSGVEGKMSEAATEVKNRGDKFLGQLLGNNNPETVTDDITNALKKQSEIHEKTKSDLYTKSNKTADEIKLNLELPNFAKSAKAYSDAIKDTTLLKHDPKVKSLFNRLKVYEKPVETKKSDILTGKDYPKDYKSAKEYEESIKRDSEIKKTPKLKEANYLAGALRSYAEQMKQNPDTEKRGLAKVFGNLSKSIKKDIHASIEKSGNKKLQSEFNTAEKNYAENFSPFLEKEIYKFTHGNKDPDTISQSFIKTSKNADRSKALETLTKKLPEKERGLVGYSYFSPAIDKVGNVNYNDLSTLVKKLGKNQIKALIPDKIMRDEIMNFHKLHKMNYEAINNMVNPKTGNRNLLAILVSALTHAGSSITGGSIGGPAGALVGLVAPGLATKVLTKWMTNPKTREELVKAIIENKSWNKNISTGIQTAGRGASS